jgi:hypothetical protein
VAGSLRVRRRKFLDIEERLPDIEERAIERGWGVPKDRFTLRDYPSRLMW